MIKLLCSLFYVVFFFCFSSNGFAEFRVPGLTSPVVDEAKLLSRQNQRKIKNILYEIQSQTGTELALLTVNSLGGLAIEDASIRVVDQWKLGSEEKDNGILLMISKGDRKIRIEVGQGHEGDLTDAHAKRIIDEVMTPLFRASRMEEGILVGLYNITKRVHPDVANQVFKEGSWNRNRGSHRRPLSKSGVIRTIIYLLAFIFLLFFRGGRGPGYFVGGGGYRTGGFGGGSFGGGGFGGGGGFSGGGASGGW